MTYSNTQPDKAMNQEQFSQVVEAILAGKYSWACVLILRFAGYNPLHYIPYRTYNRLIKENCQVGKPNSTKIDSINTDKKNTSFSSKAATPPRVVSKITDLAYLETAGDRQKQIRGGSSTIWAIGQEREKLLSLRASNF